MRRNLLQTYLITYYFDNQISGFHYAMEAKTSDFVLFKKTSRSVLNSTRSREFLNLIIHDCEFFERLQNL